MNDFRRKDELMFAPAVERLRSSLVQADNGISGENLDVWPGRKRQRREKKFESEAVITSIKSLAGRLSGTREEEVVLGRFADLYGEIIDVGVEFD